jgi:FkbM family methyltransferase
MGMRGVGIWIFKKLFPEGRAVRIIERLASFYNVDLTRIDRGRKGFLNSETLAASGEKYFIEVFLRQHFNSIDEKDPGKYVFFDVGANIGKYTRLLLSAFPDSNIYTFEPNPESFSVLKSGLEVSRNGKLHLVQQGFSSTPGSMNLSSYMESKGSSHASLHKEVFEEFHQSQNNVLIKAEFGTIDEFASQNGIAVIHLLKVDTEGHELEVLKGASSMIENGKIHVVQFEFGECQVYSRVFLRDFYLLLKGYKFYRLTPKGLFSLGDHTPALEIFQFQNIIAIRS